jgi:hypothetical protein
MQILEKMEGGPNPWVQLKKDNYWLAFGFTISSFGLISATAVALVQFGDAGCIFCIFGDLSSHTYILSAGPFEAQLMPCNLCHRPLLPTVQAFVVTVKQHPNYA